MSYNKPMKLAVIIFFSLSFYAQAKSLSFYKTVFKDITIVKTLKITDTISEFKTNVKLLEAYSSDKKRIGFIRNVTTSTGCNDGCLPVIFTLFYNVKGDYLRVLSKPGLTKKNHAEFTELDYIKLELVLKSNPAVFKKVGYPTEMVDGITGATLQIYRPHVIDKAAYSTLRVNLYNQQTQKYILKNYLK